MKQIRLGEMHIDRVVEIDSLAFDKSFLLANMTDEDVARNRDWLNHRFIEPDTNRVIISHHSFLLRTKRWTALIDTCCGNCKKRPDLPFWDQLNTPYLERLADLGIRCEEVDYVMCTHLHVDHVGWNTKLLDGRWVPTFPNARYIFGRAEFEHWNALHAAGPAQPVNRGSFEDSVLPVVAAGQHVLVETDHVLFDDPEASVRFAPAPGHTADNMVIHLAGGGDHAVASGDVIHHPLQVAAPWLYNPADIDKEQGQATRVALLEGLAESGGLLLPAHFPAPTAGRVGRRGETFRFDFID